MAANRKQTSDESRRLGADQGVRRSGPPATASGYVTDELRARILTGALSQGSRLEQQALADEIGVSVIPVREALRRLEADGLVQIYPRRGAFVTQLSLPDLMEINSIREPLEELAIRLAAPNLTEARLQELSELNERMKQLAANARPALWGQLNRDWHFTLYGFGNSRLLLELLGLLWDRSRLYRQVNAGRPENRLKSVGEHAEVLRRLRSGDSAAAGQLIRRHIRRAARQLRMSETTRSDRKAAG